MLRLQCYCHTGSTHTTQDNQRVTPGRMTYRLLTTQEYPRSYEPITHLAVNANLPWAFFPAQHENHGKYLNHGPSRQHIPEYNPGYGFAQHGIVSPHTSIVPGSVIHCTRAISPAQHENHGFNLNHNREQQNISEYNSGYGFASHNIASSNTGITTGCVIHCMCTHMHSNRYITYSAH